MRWLTHFPKIWQFCPKQFTPESCGIFRANFDCTALIQGPFIQAWTNKVTFDFCHVLTFYLSMWFQLVATLTNKMCEYDLAGKINYKFILILYIEIGKAFLGSVYDLCRFQAHIRTLSKLFASRSNEIWNARKKIMRTNKATH